LDEAAGKRRWLRPLGSVVVMADTDRTVLSLLDAVALLREVPERGLARGQVGTVVESLDDEAALVEFSDEDGRAYAIVPLPRSELLVLRYVPHAA
jgi:hypothetical protein